MKKIVFLFTFLICQISVFADCFEVSIKKIKYASFENQQYVKIDLLYRVKNQNEKTMFLYDITRRNDMHYEIDSYENNTITKKIYVFKPSNINGWYGSWGYSPCYPQFFALESGDIQEGLIQLQFTIPKDVNPFEMNYEFNFITAGCSIQPYLDDGISKDEINEKLLQNHLVRFKLQ